jgi:hypothetical protein
MVLFLLPMGVEGPLCINLEESLFCLNLQAVVFFYSEDSLSLY